MAKHFYGSFEKKGGLTVNVKNNDIAAAIRTLKRLVKNEGLLKDLRKKEYYETGTARRSREKAEAKKRWRQKLAQLQSQQ